MSNATALILSCPEYATYKSDPVVKLAIESSVVNIFWRYVPHENYIESTGDLMNKWSNFEKERSHWWRARKAVETDDHIRNKWDQLIRDLPALLNFYNCLHYAAVFLERPTLKHTLHLAAMTAEGRVYENGQGRSIASECRHIMVRVRCAIPIKARPERKTDQINKNASGTSTAKRRDLSAESVSRTHLLLESTYADYSRPQTSQKRARLEELDGTVSLSSALDDSSMQGYVRINNMSASMSNQQNEEKNAVETLLNFMVPCPVAKPLVTANRQKAVRAAAKANSGHFNDSDRGGEGNGNGNRGNRSIHDSAEGLYSLEGLSIPVMQKRKSADTWRLAIDDVEGGLYRSQEAATDRIEDPISHLIKDPINDPIKIITNTAAPAVSAARAIQTEQPVSYLQRAKPKPEGQSSADWLNQLKFNAPAHLF